MDVYAYKWVDKVSDEVIKAIIRIELYVDDLLKICQDTKTKKSFFSM